MPSLLYAPDPVAVFRGLSPVPGELEVEVVVHDGSVTLPSFGEFLLIQMSEVEAAVGRVTHCRPCGPVSSPQGENYLAELGKAGAAMPDRVRQLILRFTLRLQLLGRLKVKDGRLVFEVGLRSLAQVGAPVCRPTAAALRELCNVRLDDPNTDGLPRYKAPFGHLALGDVVNEQVEIQFDINRLKERRSFVFARAGYGKSNLMKYLIAQLYRSDPKVGLLIIDPEGEYALPSAQVPGLASLPGLRGKLRYYSQRPAPPDFTDCYAGSVFLNFKHFTGREIVTAFTPSEKQLMVWANWVKSAKPKEWAALVNLFARKDWTPMAKDVREALGKPPTDRKEDVVADAVVNNLAHVVSLIHREESTIASTLLEDLQEGRIVIVDTSAISSESARAITELLLVKVFQHNVNTFTDERRGKPVPTIAVFEEAQTTLGHHHFSENSIFVRWVKEGRKYGLGSIMITQQPGAISDQILSQGDNFFVMHLLNQGDLEALQRVNAHYGPDILRQLRSEPIKGNCYFWSAPDQPYVISARVHNFDKIVEKQQASTTELAPVVEEIRHPQGGRLAIPDPVGVPVLCETAGREKEDLGQLITLAIVSNPDVHLLPVEGEPKLAVSLKFLARKIPGYAEEAVVDAAQALGCRLCVVEYGDSPMPALVFADGTFTTGSKPRRKPVRLLNDAQPATPAP